MCVGRAEVIPGQVRFRRAAFEAFPEIADRFSSDNFLGNDSREYGTVAVDAVHLNGAAHHIQQVFHDGQAEAGTFHGAVFHLPEPFKFLKEPAQVFFPDTDAGIPHGEGQVHDISGLCFAGHRKRDGAVYGIFDGVVQEIEQDLTDPDSVAEEMVRKIFGHIHQEGQVPGLGPEADQTADVVQHRTEPVFTFPDFHFACLDPGDIEDVVDDGQQILSGVADDSGISADV